jgi:hypothetical protein
MMINPFHLFALSEAAAYTLYPLIALYPLLTVYAVLGGWPRAGDRQKIRLSWFIALPRAAFFGLWLAGSAALSLLLWLQWGIPPARPTRETGPRPGKLRQPVVLKSPCAGPVCQSPMHAPAEVRARKLPQTIFKDL